MALRDLESLLADFASAFRQHSRLLTLHFGGAGPEADRLLPLTLSGSEQLSQCFRYQLDCLSGDVGIELKTLLGLPVEVGVLTADGSRKPVSGVVTSARTVGSDGGFVKLALTIEPGLALFGLRRTSRVFQDLSVPEIVQQVVAEHNKANPVLAQCFRLQLKLEQPHPARSYTVQHNETDLAFIERLLAEEGIFYRFAFDVSADIPPHTLELVDEVYALDPAPQRVVRFHRADGTEADDTLTDWQSHRVVAPQAVSLSSYDYKQASGLGANETTWHDAGQGGNQAAVTLEDHRAETLYYAADQDGLSRYGKLRQQAYDLQAKSYVGEGNVRALNAGQWFELSGHPAHADDLPEQSQFVVLGLEQTAHNNLPDGLQRQLPSSLLNPAPEQPYRNRISAVRRGIPVIPGYDALSVQAPDELLSGLAQRHARPTAPGPQSATVVGPAGEVVYTDSLGRIKVQFHWQRLNEHPDFGAAFDERSSCWVRVAYPSAGAGFGHQFIPRIGEEVLISFLNGDIDRPICVGVIHNGRHAPPTFGGAGSLPGNKTLSGIKSEEHGGGQYNQLLFDDTPGQVRAQLSSEHGKSQLNLGFLTHPRTSGQAEPRGDGFELRTDRHGAIRAGHGLLLSAEAKQGAGGKQLDREQALSQLTAAQALAQSLGETASHQLADTLETGPATVNEDNAEQSKAKQGHHDHLTQAVKSWANGSNIKDPHGDAAGQQPILLATAPAGIALTTPDALLLASGANLDTVSQRDTQQTTARRWIHNAGKKISLFVQGVADKVNLKLITAKGHAQLHAQSGDVEIAGDKNLRIYACKGKLTAVAKEELLLTCGGAYIRLAGGNIEIHGPGSVSYKGAGHDFSGPASKNIPSPHLPKDTGQHSQKLDFSHLYEGEELSKISYKLKTSEGHIYLGVLDQWGRTQRIYSDKPDNVQVLVGDGDWQAHVDTENPDEFGDL
jgi:type VI secretion system secreted protein VgrG